MSETSQVIASVWRRAWLRRLIIAVASLTVGVLSLRLLGRISWSAVGDSLGNLVAWQLLALIAAVVVRQVLNAVSIKRFVPGLSLWQAFKNDMSANVVATVAPPPGDVVLRVAMFRSWNINPVDGMAGVTLSMIVFYGARFLAPVLGLVLVAFDEAFDHNVLGSLVSAAIAVAIIGSLFLVIRSRQWAATLGRSAARVAGKLRASIDPEYWADAVVEFRGKMESTLKGNFVPAFASTLCAIVMDGVILLLAVRFMGVGPETLSTTAILGGYLLLYPLTILPLFGLGILDVLLIASWEAVAGDTYEAAMIAATVVWRVASIGGPLAIGGLTIAAWRAEMRAQKLGVGH